MLQGDGNSRRFQIQRLTTMSPPGRKDGAHFIFSILNQYTNIQTGERRNAERVAQKSPSAKSSTRGFRVGTHGTTGRTRFRVQTVTLFFFVLGVVAVRGQYIRERPDMLALLPILLARILLFLLITPSAEDTDRAEREVEAEMEQVDGLSSQIVKLVALSVTRPCFERMWAARSWLVLNLRSQVLQRTTCVSWETWETWAAAFGGQGDSVLFVTRLMVHTQHAVKSVEPRFSGQKVCDSEITFLQLAPLSLAVTVKPSNIENLKTWRFHPKHSSLRQLFLSIPKSVYKTFMSALTNSQYNSSIDRICPNSRSK